MNAFVTGASQMLGSQLVRALVWEGWNVSAAVDSSQEAAEFLPATHVRLVEGCVQSGDLTGSDVLFVTDITTSPEEFQTDLMHLAASSGISKAVCVFSEAALEAPMNSAGIPLVRVVPGAAEGMVVDIHDVVAAMIEAAQWGKAGDRFLAGGRLETQPKKLATA